MKNKKLLLLAILFMTIGIAAVTTNVIINGSTPITKNVADYNIYFSDATINGVQDDSIITANDQITFASTFQAIGDSYKIEYTISNDSLNYDAEVSVTCTESNNYLSITNSYDTSTNIEARGTATGTLEIKLLKSYTGESEYKQDITCTLNTEAVERTSLGS